MEAKWVGRKAGQWVAKWAAMRVWNLAEQMVLRLVDSKAAPTAELTVGWLADN